MKIKLGFTLLEILATIVIFVVLSSIAIPSYRRQVTRSYVLDALSGAEIYKARVVEVIETTGNIPSSTTFATIPDGVVAEYNFDATVNAIQAVFSSSITDLSGRYIWLVPNIKAGSVDWTCGTHTNSALAINCQLLPVNCRLNCTE